MSNNLRKLVKELRSYAKKCRNIKYTDALLLTFLMTGLLTAASGTSDNSIEGQRQGIIGSISDIRHTFKRAKIENNRLLKGAELELIQLMEQGDQVVKSPWSSWQFGVNYYYDRWNGAYKGRGDKSEKYPYAGVFTRGAWWINNVSPESKTYERVETSSSPYTTSTKTRNDLGLEYGLVKTRSVPDAGVPFIIEPVINISTPPLPNLNVNPVTVIPDIGFRLPDVITSSFREITVSRLEPNVFEPPALDDVSTGFAQGYQVGIDTHPNFMVSNGDVTISGTAPLKIRVDDLDYYREGGYQFTGKNDSLQRTNQTFSAVRTGNGTRGTAEGVNWASAPANSMQTFLNVLTDSFNINGNIEFKNNTVNPGAGSSAGISSTNTLRVVSVNHAYGRVDKTIEFNMNGDINIYGRDGYGDPIIDVRGNQRYNNKPHMTIGIEHQAYGSIGARAINNGTMTLEKESAKDPSELGTNLVAMTAMIEDYSDFRTITPNTVPNYNGTANGDSPTGWYFDGTNGDTDGVTDTNWSARRQTPWESTLENKGKIVINAIDSIGIDFAQYTFRADLTDYRHGTAGRPGTEATQPKGNAAYNNKGSLNIYVKVGDIELNSTDPDTLSGIQGSYGLRVPNIFKHYQNSQVYYDETVIDGKNGEITVNGSHNVGTSVSKLITGSERVLQYQSGNLTSQPVDGAKTYLVARPNTDPIGNIYNLNILVKGTENIGLLRKSDYMEGNNVSTDGKTRARNDFVITDSHVERIDFSSDAKGGILFRTDKFGIDMSKDNFIVTAMQNRSLDASGNDLYNIVMLANGTTNAARINAPANLYLNLAADSLVKVKNTKPITIGSAPNTGYNMIGLMGYNGGVVENNADITVNTKNSIGVAIKGIAERTDNSGTVLESKESSGNSNNSNIKMTGDNSIGVYNNGRLYTMNGGSIEIEGASSTGIYASSVGTSMGTTLVNGGTITVSGNESTALYATDGADITLNGTVLNVGNNALLFYGGDPSGTDYSQINLTGNATANINSGGTAFYIKGATGDPIEKVLTSSSAANGVLTLNMASGSTLIVAEGNGGNSTIGAKVSSLSSLTSGTTPGISVIGTSGSYTPFKATRLHLLIDKDSDFDNPADAYLNSEFSSSSVTLDSGITISGSGAITSPAALSSKSKVAIAQKNITSGVTRNDVILTNNGTINFTGNEMVGIAGENAVILNNGKISTTGNDSSAIISANGSIATNNGSILIGNKGIGIAGINYFGATDSPAASIPSYGDKSIEIVHNGTIGTVGTTSGSIGILAIDLDSNTAGAINAANEIRITLGNNSAIDMSKSPVDGIGVYSKGILRNGIMANVTDNGSNIKIGTGGTGFYLEGTELTATGGIITADAGVAGKGIYTDSNVLNNKNITLTGDKSIGIHNYGVNSQYTGNLVNILNTGILTLGDSTDKNNPSIGIYTKSANIDHQGVINGGKKTLGIYSETTGDVLSSGNISVGDEGTGILKKSGMLNITGTVAGGSYSTAVYGDNGVSIINNSSNISVGDNSFGFVIMDSGTNNYTGTSASRFEMGSNSVYLYRKGSSGTVNSSTSVISSGISSTGFYADSNSILNNMGLIDFSNSKGSVGAYAQNGGRVNNLSGGIISIGDSDISVNLYSIGMAAKNGGTVYNDFGGTINVTGNYGIGMFAEGINSRAENHGTINLVSAGELKGSYGMYLDNQATGVNYGTIISGRYGNDVSKSSLFGVAVMNGATLENHGVIDIDANGSYGIYIKDGVIKNYGTIRIAGLNSVGIRNRNGTDEFGNPITDSDLSEVGIIANGDASAYINVPNTSTQPALAGSTVISPTGVVTIDGKVVAIHDMTPGPDPLTGNFAFSNVGIYIDTLGRTKPIEWVDGFVPSDDNDLIIGAEAAELSTAKAIKIGSHIITPYILPYMNMGGGTGKALNAISGSLTWTAQPIVGSSGLPEEVIMAKIPYTDFVDKSENAWNFADGLEQRYGVEGLDSREKALFNKLNSIGKNEQVLLTQAYDEMMGHQYANTQQRIHETSGILSKELDHIRDDWDTVSKESNKVKVFGMRNEYRTDTAGVIDYKSDSYGVAYLHEDETIKLGESTGWYAGAVYNRFKFSDIGKSVEKQTMVKGGVYRTTSFDDNGSLKWTISGEGFIGQNDMKRRFLVVDEIFNAKGTYYSYGAALKNEISREFRTSERTSITPYGSLKLEYGRFSRIKEKDGEVRLEVEGNDYYSIKPEVGVEFKYRQPLAKKTTLTAGIGIAYENELGKVGDTDNRGRVAYTEADWFGIRGEKDDRKGNFKADLNVGIENQRIGVTFNAGYDTKGENFRAGMGLRAIY